MRFGFLFLILFSLTNLINAQVSQVDNTILLVDDQAYFPFGIYTEGVYENEAYLEILDSPDD